MALPAWVRSEWDRWTYVVGLFVATGYVAGEPAQSLMLVGPPGSGKSTMVRRFRSVPIAREISDITADPLRRIIFADAATKGLKHLLFPEFHKCFQRKPDTVQNMVGYLTAAMSGELANNYIGLDHLAYPDVQMGIIAAMVPDVFHVWSRSMLSQGVLDRVTVMHFELPKKELLKIERAILAGTATPDTAPIAWPYQLPVAVTYKPDGAFVEALTEWLDAVRRKGNRNRIAGQVRGLLKASAMLDNRTVVDTRDLDTLYTLQPLFQF